MSQPAGVWKFVAPRSAIAPGGVPMSSGTRKTRATASAASRDSIGVPTNVTSSLIMPTPPTGRLIVTWKIGVAFPVLRLQVIDELVAPVAFVFDVERLLRLERRVDHEAQRAAGLEDRAVPGVLRQQRPRSFTLGLEAHPGPP